MASHTTCTCRGEIPRSFRKARAALAPSTSNRLCPVYRSVKPRSWRTVDMAKSSGSGAGSAPCESKIPNSQERITWLKRYGSDELRANSIASRTRLVSGTLIHAKITFFLSRWQIVVAPQGNRKSPLLPCWNLQGVKDVRPRLRGFPPSFHTQLLLTTISQCQYTYSALA